MIPFSRYADNELTDLLRDGSVPAFTEIYNRYWKKMLLISWNHTKDKKLAEDIVHEVFVSVWEKKAELYIDNIAAFLTTAIKFTVFKNYQREYRRKELARQNYIYNEIDFDEERLDALFLKEYIDGLVEELPERCRLVFKYSREMGMKNAEIAREMQISEKGVEANLTRALKILKGGLQNSGLFIFIALEVQKGLF